MLKEVVVSKLKVRPRDLPGGDWEKSWKPLFWTVGVPAENTNQKFTAWAILR
jgi:hypothetical protein